MINLREIGKDSKASINEHFMFFDYYIGKKIAQSKPTYNSNLKAYHKLSNIDKPYIQNLCRFLSTKDSNNQTFYERVLISSPNELSLLNEKFIEFTDSLFDEGVYALYFSLEKSEKKKLTEIHDYFQTIDKLFNYNELIDASPSSVYSAYHLAKNIGIRTCVYCNRVYTVTHNTKVGGKLMRPQFDHWFPQSKYPLLAVSFYNLIPSCSSCNSSVKGDKEMDLKMHTHPYIKNEIDDDFAFTYQYKKTTREFEILIQQIGVGAKNKDTLEFLKINEMYDAHQDELEDLLTIKQAYSKAYLRSLKDTFPGANLTDDEIYRLAFGTELNSKDFHKRPMSKFKHDILKELGII
jgi:hypothetical protein